MNKEIEYLTDEGGNSLLSWLLPPLSVVRPQHSSCTVERDISGRDELANANNGTTHLWPSRSQGIFSKGSSNFFFPQVNTG